MERQVSKSTAHKIEGRVILVTGGAGFVGSTLVNALLPYKPSEIRVLDLSENGAPPNLIQALSSKKVTFLNGDIRNREIVEQAVAGVDYVFHQAAIRVTKCQEVPRLALEVLIDGTFNVLEAATKLGVKKIIAASSAIVYGPPQYLPVDEKHPLLDRTMYGIAKITNEQFLEGFFQKYGIPYVVLRYFNIYGPRMNLFGPHTEVLIKWLDRIDEGQTPLIFGDGKQTMDFVYIDDVVLANVLALESNVTNDVFNVGTGRETSLNELVKLLLRLTKSSLQPEYREARVVNQIPRRFADIKKAARVLGFQSQVSLEEGLAQLITWRANNLANLRKA